MKSEDSKTLSVLLEIGNKLDLDSFIFYFELNNFNKIRFIFSNLEDVLKIKAKNGKKKLQVNLLKKILQMSKFRSKTLSKMKMMK